MQNIFGDSDEELEEVEVELSEGEDELPNFKKSIPKLKLKKIREPSQQTKLSPKSSKLSEAANDIDDILKRLKPARARNNLTSEIQIDETINTLMESMRTAAFNDQEFNRNKEPAIAKLKLLPSLMIHLSKTLWFSQFLDAGILECIKFWLEPLSDGSLPSLDIQKAMVETLEQMPIDTHHLRSSLVGRVVMFYTKCPRYLVFDPRVSPTIKRKCEVMIRRWMRPILGKSSNHKHKVMREMRYDAPTRVHKKATVNPG